MVKFSNGNGWVSGIHMSLLVMASILVVHDHDHACREWHDMLQVTVGKDVSSYSRAYIFSWIVLSKDRR